jgi:hypothetical protein
MSRESSEMIDALYYIACIQPLPITDPSPPAPPQSKAPTDLSVAEENIISTILLDNVVQLREVRVSSTFIFTINGIFLLVGLLQCKY